jgi:hypothetical protein
MKKIYLNVACAGMDVHYKFSNVTFRDRSGKVVRRERLVHPGRKQLQESAFVVFFAARHVEPGGTLLILR